MATHRRNAGVGARDAELYLATVQRRSVALNQGHRGVLTVTIEIATGHGPVGGGEDFDLRFSRRGVDEHSSEPAGGGAAADASSPLSAVSAAVQLAGFRFPLEVITVASALASVVPRCRRPALCQTAPQV